MKNIKIKNAEIEDCDIILQFIKNLAEYENLSHEVTATKESLEISLFKNRDAEALIAYYKDLPVGFAIYFHNFSTFLGKKGLYLEDLFVLPEYRGKGIGKQMLKHLSKLALERDCGRFEWAVLDWNDPALKFYEKLGADFKKEWIITRLTGDPLKILAE
jgi:GNAT superfamily N-acetyltransferase